MKARSLSQAGHAVLIQSVASSIPSYIMSVFMLPKRVTRAIDIRLKIFFWGFDDGSRHFHPKSWESICKPKLSRGFGQRKMEDLNRALVAKLGWDLARQRDCLRVKALLAKYCRGGDFLRAQVTSGGSWIWNSVMQTQDLIRAGYCWHIKGARRINIWCEPWVPTLPGYTPKLKMGSVVDPHIN